MIELSRRLFVFGSAAALAAAAVPAIEQSVIAPPIFTPVPALQPFLRRGIYDLMASFDANAGAGPATFEILREERCLFTCTIDQRSFFRWVARRPLEEIVILPHGTLKMAVRSESGIGQINMICHDKIDDGPPVEVCETHTFPQRGPATIAYLHVDNSKEARIERAEARKREAESWDDDDDVDDLY